MEYLAPASPIRLASPGRIVLYTMRDGVTERPAIVVLSRGVTEGVQYVNLQVFTDELDDGLPQGTLWEKDVPHAPEGRPRTWRWPRLL